MSELIENWLTFLVHNKGRAESTAAKYRQYLQRLLEWSGDRDPLELTRPDLEEFVGIAMHKAGLSPRSRRALVAAIRGFYEYLEREGVVSVSPARAIHYPKAGKKQPTMLSLKNAERLLMQPDLDDLKGVRDAAILAVLIGAGVRVSGLCRLNESDLLWMHDDDDREVMVIRVTEKGSKQRLVPVAPETLYMVRAYLGHPDLKQIDRSLDSGDKVLFVSLRNRFVPVHEYHGEARRIAARSINAMIETYGENAGIPREQLHPHAMRHLYGTELMESDVPDSVGQVLMGHSDPSSYQVYMHLALRKLMQVVNKASPMTKINTPMSHLVKQLEKL